MSATNPWSRAHPAVVPDDVRCRPNSNHTVIVRPAVAVICLAAVGCLAGCSTTPPKTATIRGLLERPLLSDFPVKHHQLLAAAGVVRVVQGSNVVATVNVGKSGTFSLRLPPGNYSLDATVTAGFPLGTTCNTGHVVHARANRTVVADVVCHYPPATIG